MILQILRRAPRLLAPVARIYGYRLNQCGATAKGVFWKDEDLQERRFQRMAEIFHEDDAAKGGVTINDFGCGYGAFFQFLAKHPVMQGSTYYGYDISQGMIASARDLVTDPRARFLRKMWATKKADYSFASGTYNLNANAEDEAWLEYVQASILQLWEKTDKALAFNMLREDAEEQYDGLYYTDPDRILSFCREKLSDNIEMFDERPMPDVTFFVRR